MRLKKFSAFISINILIFACTSPNRDPGYSYISEMRKSPSIQTSELFIHDSTLKQPVNGTVPFKYLPDPYNKKEERQTASKYLKKPEGYGFDSLSEGKTLYEIYCKICHGTNGNGKGELFTGGKYPNPPANLLSETMMLTPSGEIYHVITKGSGLMGGQANNTTKFERWLISGYIKNYLQEDTLP